MPRHRFTRNGSNRALYEYYRRPIFENFLQAVVKVGRTAYLALKKRLKVLYESIKPFITGNNKNIKHTEPSFSVYIARNYLQCQCFSIIYRGVFLHFAHLLTKHIE